MQNSIVVISGATASGKTSLAVDLAIKFNGEIVNADSVIFYKYMNIGSAKPRESEKMGIQHYLIDIIEPDQHFTAFDFKKMGDKSIESILKKGKLPIVVGGSPLYTKALLKGLFELPPIPENIIKSTKELIDFHGLEWAHQELSKIDIDASNRIHPNDRLRVERALQVYYAFNKPITELQNEHSFKENHYNYIKLSPNISRDTLYQRINTRVDKMIENGLIEEVIELKKMGYHPSKHKSMQSIGYKEIFMFLEGDLSLFDSIELIKINTRHFAKRQLSWLRGECDVKWINEPLLKNAEIDVLKFFETIKYP
ncbi:tRNA (adenosine(37)-N6)-dimethylallyltransferase MiaA [bacterium]|nr:tRNA (adenosine(37)-N6)-dimethylallyltransferase MiaA [bacterium]